MLSGEISGIKLIDIPLNTITSIAGKPAKVTDSILNGIRNYYHSVKEVIKNVPSQIDYRTRASYLYENLKGIKPLANSSLDKLFMTNNYIEQGIVSPIKINTIKQLWTEFRLIYNEHNRPAIVPELPVNNYQESYIIDNFDNLFDKLSKSVSGANKYIEDLVSMKENLSSSNRLLENEQHKLDEERNNFNQMIETERKQIADLRQQLIKDQNDFADYKKVTEESIKKEQAELANHFKRLQDLTDNLNNRLTKITE